MHQRPAAHGGHHEDSRTLSGSARARLATAVRDDRAHPRPGPSAGTSAGEPPLRLPPEDGLEPVRRLGGRSWLVREARSGEHFVLRPCTQAPGPERDRSRVAARSLAVALAGREEPCLVAVRGLLGPAAAPVGVVEEFLAGGSLADRLAECGRLEPAEAAAVLRDAATGLAVLHELGRSHGELSTRQILFRATATTDGAGPRPAVLRAGAAAGSAEEDVRALGAVGWAALTGRAPAREARRVPLTLLCPDAPPGLVRSVEAALDPDPAARPTAEELAARLVRPLEPGPDAPGTPARHPPARVLPGPRRRAPSGGGRRVLPVAAASLLLAAGGAVLLPWQGTSPPSSPPPSPAAVTPAGTATASPARTLAPERPGTTEPGPVGRAPLDPADVADPRRALRELVARRGEALRTGDARLLEQVYAPGAEAAAADRDTIARGAGAFTELVLEVGSVRDAPAGASDPGTVALVAEVRVDGYRGGPGTYPSVVAAGDGWVQTVLVVLVEGERGWRLAGVAPASGSTAGPEPQEPARQDPRG